MELIPLEVVVANIFATGREVVTTPELFELRKLICITFEELDVDYDKDSFIAMTQKHPEIFALDLQRGIIRGSWNNPKKVINNWVDKSNAIPKEIKSRLIGFIKSEIDKGFDQYFLVVFTQDYTDKVFNRQIPEEYREQFTGLIRNYIKDHPEPTPA